MSKGEGFRRCVAAVLTALLAAGAAVAAPPCEPGPDCVLKRWHPAGGWNPYGGGLLHWWDPHCLPRGGSPDDYCRKTLPAVCWPPYPACFLPGPPPSAAAAAPAAAEDSTSKNR